MEILNFLQSGWSTWWSTYVVGFDQDVLNSSILDLKVSQCVSSEGELIFRYDLMSKLLEEVSFLLKIGLLLVTFFAKKGLLFGLLFGNCWSPEVLGTLK